MPAFLSPSVLYTLEFLALFPFPKHMLIASAFFILVAAALALLTLLRLGRLSMLS